MPGKTKQNAAAAPTPKAPAPTTTPAPATTQPAGNAAAQEQLADSTPVILWVTGLPEFRSGEFQLSENTAVLTPRARDKDAQRKLQEAFEKGLASGKATDAYIQYASGRTEHVFDVALISMAATQDGGVNATLVFVRDPRTSPGTAQPAVSAPEPSPLRSLGRKSVPSVP